MSSHTDVLIIGGGVIGLTTAHTLALAGLSVSLLDSGDLGKQASWAGAGIIPPGNLISARTPLERFRAVSSNLYPTLSASLLESTGIDNGYRVCGGLELLSSSSDHESDEYRGAGIDCRLVSGSELQEFEPKLNRGWERAYWIPEMAQIRNPRHLQALIASCQRLGVRLLPNCPARSLVLENSRLVGVKTDTGPLQAGNYVLAAGTWSQALLEPLGWDLRIWPVRGQIALLNIGRQNSRPLLLSGKRYLVPRGDGRVLVGSTEEDAGFVARPTEEGIAGLLTFATSVLAELKDARLETSWAGLRPGSRDGLPTVGWVPGVDNLLVAAGHFRVGLQLSPATALVLSQLILGQAPALSLTDFRLHRHKTQILPPRIPHIDEIG